MPITQSRMISLINASRDCLNALKQMRVEVDHQCTLTHAGEKSATEALETLRIILSMARLLQAPDATLATIAIEGDHFARHKARNQRAKNRQELARQKLYKPKNETSI